MNIRAIIIDDERHNRENLLQMLAGHCPDVEVIAVCKTTVEVGCKKLEDVIKNLRSNFIVKVLRTTQFIRRIRAIDIVSIWEIPAIACRAFISIENEPPQYAIARSA